MFESPSNCIIYIYIYIYIYINDIVCCIYKYREDTICESAYKAEDTYPNVLERLLEEFETRGNIWTIQTTVMLRSARLLRIDKET